MLAGKGTATGDRLKRGTGTALVAAFLCWGVFASQAHAVAQQCCLGFEAPGQVAVAPGSEHVYVSDLYVTLALRLDAATGTLSLIDSYDGGGALMAMSSDGRFLYQAPAWPPQHRVINVWQRDPATGALSVVGSWKAASDGEFADIELSPDGAQLYVTDASRDALTILDRDQATGKLAYRSELRNGENGTTGVSGASGMTVTPDGRWVYLAQSGRPMWTSGFERRPDGSLVAEPSVVCECISGRSIELSPDTSWLISGPTGPYAMRRDTTTGELRAVQTEFVSTAGGDELKDGTTEFTPGGEAFYTIDRWQNRLFQFDLGTAGPRLARTYRDGAGGTEGISDPRAIALTPDGRFLLLSARGAWGPSAMMPGSVAVFRRDPATNALSYSSIFRGPSAGTESPPRLLINDGAEYTNDPQVTLTLEGASWLFEVEISNDGGFGNSSTVRPSDSRRYPWRLQSSGPERLPKTVYLRTTGMGSHTVTDDIVLDERPPQITSLSIAKRTNAARAAATARLRVGVRDRVSGVASMQVTSNKRRPGKWKSFKSSPSVSTKASTLWVRVRDRAGNASRWRGLKVKR